MSAQTLFKGILIFIVCAVIAGGGIYLWSQNHSDTELGRFVLDVGPSDSISDIAQKLKEHNIISFAPFFYAAHFLFGQEAAVAPGAYELSPNMSVKQVVLALDRKPYAEYINIPANTSKSEMGKIIGKALGWKDVDIQFFGHTLAGMQWQRYKDVAESEFLKRFHWSQSERETFLSLTAMYDEEDYDFFKNVYEPGAYQIPVNASRAQAAGAILDQFAKKYGDKEMEKVAELMDTNAMDEISKLLNGEMELLPDIVALPPSDVTLKTENGRTYLLFTTAYWNKGRGPLEIVADPATKGIKADIVRKVFQRIYRLDGDYRERLSGSFLWHQPHLHYHFADFALYTLTAVDPATKSFKTVGQAKSTFCIRDSEPIDFSSPGAGKTPSYTICGKERQGISAGWADAYYYNYVDQRFDVTGAPQGQYLLTITINPEDRFEEVTKDNDKAEVLLLLNVKDNFVEVLEERSYGK